MAGQTVAAAVGVAADRFSVTLATVSLAGTDTANGTTGGVKAGAGGNGGNGTNGIVQNVKLY